MTRIPPTILADILDENATRYPDVAAYVEPGREITHRELRERAGAITAALEASGLDRQDRIALYGRNSIEFGEVLAAGQLSGIVVATVNFRLATAEVAAVLADVAPRIVFVDNDLAPVVAAVRERVPSIELVVCLDGTSGPDIVGFQDFIARAGDAAPTLRARPEDIACLVFTGGTTGRPKACILGQREMREVASTMSAELRTGSQDTVLIVMPMFHIGAMAIVLGIHARGGTAVLHRQFDPSIAVGTVADRGISVLHLAPTMLQALVTDAENRQNALAGVRTVVYSAAPITSSTLAAAMEAMPEAGFLNLYGQTEVITSGLPRELHSREGSDSARRRLTSVGFPFPGTRVRIMGADGTDAAPGEPGEILVRTTAMFRGYWNDSAATSATIHDGWCRTGDIGVLDGEGLLSLVDRKKDVIISGGENIYSLEVEDAVTTHPDVLECAVVGVPDERWGESVCAVVVTRAGSTITLDELREYLDQRLARYKLPKRLDLVAEIPKLPTGKLDKKRIRRSRSD
ncbi:AMP-binding protein [Nocardia sp. NBC_01388]|uniref:AMP-binding protein n=1 Tax=Nocardia sp. NBC_01388 TaxID=2903596 RepID=UPI003254456A